jgi:hypothetical protein
MLRRLFQSLTAVLVGGFAAGLLGGGQILASRPALASDSSYSQITNHDGKCLDMTNGSTSDGAQPQLWICNANQQQFWAFVGIPGFPTSQFLIQNYNSRKCLSIKGNDPYAGGEVIQWDCNYSGSDAFEVWTQIPNNPSGYFQLSNTGSQPYVLVMHPSGCAADNGTKMFMNRPYECNADYWI